MVTITSEQITSEQAVPAPEPEPAKPATPVIRYTKDEGDRIAYYINTKLAAEVGVSASGIKDTCYNGTKKNVNFPTDEWRTDPKIRQDQKDAMEFVLDEIEARNTRLRPLRGY